MSNIINGTASEYEMPATINEQPTRIYDKHDYAESSGRNHEYYKDPTYHAARRNIGNRVPVYTRHKSRRYETIGLIVRICHMAGFELAERVVLRDKATGEVFR